MSLTGNTGISVPSRLYQFYEKQQMQYALLYASKFLVQICSIEIRFENIKF